MKLKIVIAAASRLCLRPMENVLRNLGPRPTQGWAMLLVCLAGITSALCPLPCQAQSPTITSVSKITTAQFQTITIKGSGFGTMSPYTGDSAFISLEDQTANPGWQAGYSPFNDTVTLIVNSWQDHKITLGGFSGAWGTHNYTLAIGDSEQVEVWNAQTGEGPAIVYVTVVGETTTITLTSSPNPSTLGEPVTFTAKVTSGEGAPPDGETVSFMQGKTVLGTGTLSGGSASFTTSTLKVGTHSVAADYSGDSDFAKSKSKLVKQVVN
jgi:Bacterial Ig-like domain (group 3)